MVIQIFVLMCILSRAWDNADEPTVTPKAELFKINQDVREAWVAYNRKVKDKLDPIAAEKSFVEVADPRYKRALQLALDNPKDPVAPAALEYLLSAPWHPQKTLPVIDKAYEELIARHVTNLRIARICRMCFRWDIYSSKPEEFLRLVIAKNRSREVQGCACFALARTLHGFSDWSAAIRDPEKSEATEKRLARNGQTPADLIQRIKSADPAQLSAEAEQLIDRVIREFGDVKLYHELSGIKVEEGQLADRASELRELWKKPG